MRRIDDALARLATLSPAGLKAEWLALCGAPVPCISPRLMQLALAWEVQARALGGLSRATQQTLTQLANARTRTVAAAPGTRLVREWQGRVHVVTIDEDQLIHWEGRGYRSLSEVAREITGTRWSGPAFFGLKKKLAA